MITYAEPPAAAAALRLYAFISGKIGVPSSSLLSFGMSSDNLPADLPSDLSRELSLSEMRPGDAKEENSSRLR